MSAPEPWLRKAAIPLSASFAHSALRPYEPLARFRPVYKADDHGSTKRTILDHAKPKVLRSGAHNRRSQDPPQLLAFLRCCQRRHGSEVSGGADWWMLAEAETLFPYRIGSNTLRQPPELLMNQH